MKNIKLYLALIGLFLALPSCHRSYYEGQKLPKQRIETKLKPILPYVNIQSLPRLYWYGDAQPQIAAASVLSTAKSGYSIAPGFNNYTVGVTRIYGEDILNNISQLSTEDIDRLDVTNAGVADLRILSYKRPKNPIWFLINTATCVGYPATWVGLPYGHRIASISLAVDIKTPDGKIIKTYQAKGRHTAMVANYWGFNVDDARMKAHDKAFTKALAKIKREIAKDAASLNAQLPDGYMSPEAVNFKKYAAEGNKAFDNENHQVALESYQQAKANKSSGYTKEDAEFLYKFGYTLYKKSNGEAMEKQAVECLQQSLELNPSIDLMAPLSLYLIYSGRNELEEAGKWIDFARKNYQLNDKQQEVINELEAENNARMPQIKAGKALLATPVEVNIENLGSNINGSADDFFPSLAADESVLYLTSERKGSVGGTINQDLWYSQRNEDGSWATPKNMGTPVNTANNNGIASITGDGQYVICASCNDPAGFGNCDIYGASLSGITWSTPVNLGANINSSGWDSQANISVDGKTLFFVSAREGGQGGEDIWMAKKEANGNWQEAVNLGPAINTAGNEKSPFLHPDGKTLYFSSNLRGPCIGGLDIYKTVMQEDGTWSEPENLGYPINSAANDMHFVLSPSGLYGLMASDRQGSLGGDDIFSIKFPEKAKTSLITFIGYVFDTETKEPLQATVSIVDLGTQELVGTYQSNQTNGKFVVVLRPGGNYSLSVDKKTYLFYSENFDIPSDNSFQEIEKNIFLDKVKVGSKIVLKNIFFDTGLATLRKESENEIDKLYQVMIDNPSISVEISGHTDNVGSNEFNVNLSKQRAQVVSNALIAKGINAMRFKSVGYGKERPVADNSSEEGRQLNRRTEFQVLSQ